MKTFKQFPSSASIHSMVGNGSGGENDNIVLGDDLVGLLVMVFQNI